MVINQAYERERELIKGEYQLFPPPPHPLPPTLHPPRESWWAQHGEMLFAVLAGCLLAAATVLSWVGRDQTIAYHAIVYTAFALGFFFGASKAWESLRQGLLDIHFLMVLGAILALVVNKEMEGAILLFLFTLSGALEHYAMQRTHAALESLTKLFPKEATLLLPDGTQKLVQLEHLQLGDHVLVKPGENVAADGVVIEGCSAIDESAITGEYLPREKQTGQKVYAGTLNTTGRLVVEVEKPAHDTTLAKIIHLVSQAREEKAPVERLFERIGTIYTIGVLVMSVSAALLLHYVWGLPWIAPASVPGEAGALYRAITLLIVASPCALIISTPVVTLSAIATCARKGIILKGGRHLESLAALKAMVFDKTGTLTRGQVRLVGIEYISTSDSLLHCDLPGVVSDHPDADGKSSQTLEEEQRYALRRQASVATALVHENGLLEKDEVEINRRLLQAAASLEANSSHPLAAAVMRAAREAGLSPLHLDSFTQEPGLGLRGMVNGELVIIGSPALLDGVCHTLSVKRICQRVAEIQNEGQTAVVIYYARCAGLLRFADTLRDNITHTIDELHQLSISPLVMLTGDNPQAAATVAQMTGVDEFHAQLLPQEKLRQIERLVQRHRVVGMVGDGINDAPSLARATVGIAMGTIGSDTALQAADVVLLSDRIDYLPWLIATSRHARRVMMQNLSFALGVIVLLIVFTFFGKVPLPLGVIGHEGSTLLVVLNGLRLLIGRSPRQLGAG